MLAWIWQGLRTGIVTTRYPKGPAVMPPAYRGRPVLDPDHCDPTSCRACADACLPRAITVDDGVLRLDLGRCISCAYCVDACPASAFSMRNEVELAARQRGDLVTELLGEDAMGMGMGMDMDTDATRSRDSGDAPLVVSLNGARGDAPDARAIAETRAALRRRIAPFRRSLHIRHVDAGSDGSEEAEILALGNPYYDIHRLGLFFTPSPRHADLLLVTGPVTRAMAEPLRRTYEAMPFPKLVVAAGTSACSGGIYGASYATLGGVDTMLPVDVYIPGTPPSPFALLYGLLLAVGRLDQRIRATRLQARGGGVP